MYQLQFGGGSCSLCGSPGTNKSSCPCNPSVTKPNFAKHPMAKNCSGSKVSPPRASPRGSPPKPSKIITNEDNYLDMESLMFKTLLLNTQTMNEVKDLTMMCKTNKKLLAVCRNKEVLQHIKNLQVTVPSWDLLMDIIPGHHVAPYDYKLNLANIIAPSDDIYKDGKVDYSLQKIYDEKFSTYEAIRKNITNIIDNIRDTILYWKRLYDTNDADFPGVGIRNPNSNEIISKWFETNHPEFWQRYSALQYYPLTKIRKPLNSYSYGYKTQDGVSAAISKLKTILDDVNNEYGPFYLDK
jgi:hypothetical protein